MYKGKAKYLEELTSQLKFRSVDVSTNLEGSTPPSVFVGRAGYPKVFIGPMMSLEKESSFLDLPEEWLTANKTNEEIVNLRMQLVRGKQLANIKQQDSFVEKMQAIALAKNTVEIEARFKSKPKGRFFHEEMQPFGPSAELKTFHAGNSKFNPYLEKAYYDNDLKASDAVILLNKKGLLISQLQKALSTGAFGIKRQRKLVPTRWSITAVDTIVADNLLKEVKYNPIIDNFKVYEHFSMQNRFEILLMPSTWQFEVIESFIHVLGTEQLMFSDYETHFKKKEYALIGGGYYAARLAIAEFLSKCKKQASIVIFREAYPGYIPLGVWNVRENTRKALNSNAKEFDNLDSALKYIGTKMYIPLSKWINKSKVLKNYKCQKTLHDFL